MTEEKDKRVAVVGSTRGAEIAALLMGLATTLPAPMVPIPSPFRFPKVSHPFAPKGPPKLKGKRLERLQKQCGQVPDGTEWTCAVPHLFEHHGKVICHIGIHAKNSECVQMEPSYRGTCDLDGIFPSHTGPHSPRKGCGVRKPYPFLKRS
jgi:hypothetical protein